MASSEEERVVLNGETSQWAPVESGVPQGSVLWPILFLVYINDISEGVTSRLSIFADDTKLYKHLNSDLDKEVLQQDIQTLHEWTKTWEMEFNVSKCSVVHLGFGNSRSSYYLDGTEIPSAKCVKDLGVYIQEDGKWDFQIKNVTLKCNSQVNKSFQNKCSSLMMKIYKTYILPILDYCVCVWNPYMKKDILALENVQRRFTRCVSGLRNYEYEERLRFLGLKPLADRRSDIDMVQCYKILHNYTASSPNMLTLVSNTHNRHTRGATDDNIAHIKTRLNLRRNFFSHRIVERWNRLPSEVKRAETVTEFKNRLKYC